MITCITLFKGMEQIIQECGLWPESGNLLAQCEGLRCEPGQTNCCCWWLLFTQPDFVVQRLQLEEFIVVKKGTFELFPRMQIVQPLGDQMTWQQVTIDNMIISPFHFVYP